MPYDLNLNFTRTRIVDPRLNVTRASKKTDAGGWDFTSGGTVGVLAEYASGVAAIHPTVGLLVEEGSTNEITNPRAEGSTAGDISGAGALPTGWTFFENSTVVSSVVGTGTEGGWPYLEMSFIGTATGVEVSLINFETASVVGASATQTWTGSAGHKIVSGDLTNVTSFEQYMTSYLTGTPVEQLTETIVPDATHKRYFITKTLGAGTVDSVANGFRLVFEAGPVNVTIRIYCPQLENKAYPTSPVMPEVSSPAASTRARDQISIPLPATFFSNAGGTIYTDMTAGPGRADSVRQVPWALYLSSSQRLYPYFSDKWNLFAWDGSDIIPSTSGFTLSTVLSSHRIAVYLSDANMKWAINGAGGSTEDYSITPSATLGISSYNKLIIGSSNNIRCLNGYIKDLRYWPRELSDSEMASLVGI